MKLPKDLPNNLAEASYGQFLAWLLDLGPRVRSQFCYDAGVSERTIRAYCAGGPPPKRSTNERIERALFDGEHSNSADSRIAIVQSQFRASYERTRAQADSNGIDEIQTEGCLSVGGSFLSMAATDKPTIVVLPVVIVNDDLRRDILVDGLVDDIIFALSCYPSLAVASRNTSLHYEGQPHAALRDKLGVRYVLEVSLRREGNRVRITTQLIDTDKDHSIFSRRYDKELQTFFTLWDEISTAVAQTIPPAVGHAERRRAMRKPPATFDAWQAYQSGRHYLGQVGPEQNKRAQEWLRKAIDLDPTFAASHANLALALHLAALTFRTIPIEAALDEADRHARRAIELDGADAEARTCLAQSLGVRGDHEAALEQVEIALATAPNLAFAHGVRGAALTFSGRPRQGLEALETCVRLDLRDPMVPTRLLQKSVALYFCKDYPAAVSAVQSVIQAYPDSRLAYRWLTAGLAQAGRINEAKEVLTTITEDMLVRPLWMRESDYAHLLDGITKASGARPWFPPFF